MKLLFMGNNRLGLLALRYLQDQGEEIVGLAIHPEHKRTFGNEIIAASGLPEERILSGELLNTPSGLDRVRELQADCAISVLFDYILGTPFLESFSLGVVNLHPSLLPYNKGQYPNVWSIIDGTPAGVTLHYIDVGVDTGDIISQKPIKVEAVDTGESLYRKLEIAGLELLKETWEPFKLGKAGRVLQPIGRGSSHRRADVARVDEIHLERSYNAKALLDILRARTFPPYRGAFFMEGSRKVYLRLHLEYGEEE